MRFHNWDLSALFVYAVAVALQMIWLMFVEETVGNHLLSELLPVLFLT